MITVHAEVVAMTTGAHVETMADTTTMHPLVETTADTTTTTTAIVHPEAVVPIAEAHVVDHIADLTAEDIAEEDHAADLMEVLIAEATVVVHTAVHTVEVLIAQLVEAVAEAITVVADITEAAGK